MGPAGEDITEHLGHKYGSTAEQQAQIRETIRQRGAQKGFAFRAQGRGRTWNTFDAHRLLHWATAEGAPGDALALKKALLTSYQCRAENPSDPAVLLAVVQALQQIAWEAPSHPYRLMVRAVTCWLSRAEAGHRGADAGLGEGGCVVCGQQPGLGVWLLVPNLIFCRVYRLGASWLA